MAAWFFSEPLLLSVLFAGIHCLPVKNGFDPTASYGNSYPNAAPSQLGLNRGAPSNQFAAGAFVPNVPSFKSVPQPQLPYPQPGALRDPMASVGSSSSGPVQLGYTSSFSVNNSPAGAKRQSAPLQPGPQDISWAVAPPKEPSAPVVVGPENMSPTFLPPPGPVFQAGELTHTENSFEHGNYETETQEQGSVLPLLPAGLHFSSEPLPELGPPSTWGWFPYPYDFIFLISKSPPGTVTHFSSSFELGRDHWHDTLYVRDYAPSSTGQQKEQPAAQNAVMTGYGQGAKLAP